MKFKVIELKGVGPQGAKALEKAGFYYADSLLEMDEKKISKTTGIPEEVLLRWKSYVLLMKIHSLGPAYANILFRDDVGVKNIDDLAKSDPEKLLEKMTQSNKKRRIVKVLPTLAKLKRWIEEAKNK